MNDLWAVLWILVGTGAGFYIGWNIGYQRGVVDCAEEIMKGWKAILKREIPDIDFTKSN
jgi:hypothetical protein